MPSCRASGFPDGEKLGRLDAEGDDAAEFGGGAPDDTGFAEFLRVEDDVIGGECEDDGLWIAPDRVEPCGAGELWYYDDPDRLGGILASRPEAILP